MPLHLHFIFEERARGCRHRLRRIHRHRAHTPGLGRRRHVGAQGGRGRGPTNASIALTVISLAAAAVASGAIIVTLARVGWLKTPLSDRLVHIGNWLVFAWPAIGTLDPLSTWGQRAVSLPLAIAAFVVARSRPRPHAGEAPWPPVMRLPVPH
ncbi:MAG TPA: hypothetical protein VKG38_17380 [Solirubrobacteraceae bacterium]|nr:hypothetical protein [Solirubrobacteraceae bacterium]